MGPFARDRLLSTRLNEDDSRQCSRCENLLPKDSAGDSPSLALTPAGDFAKSPDGSGARRTSPPAEPFAEMVFPGSD